MNPPIPFCHLCHKQPAVIFVKLAGERNLEHGLCQECASQFLDGETEVKGLTFSDQELLKAIADMRSVILGIVQNIQHVGELVKEKELEHKEELCCAHCGYPLSRFQHTGNLGCPYCYVAFQKPISHWIFDAQRGGEHVGQMPPAHSRIHVLKKELLALHRRLQYCVESENYEEALKIKQNIQAMVGQYNLGDLHAMD